MLISKKAVTERKVHNERKDEIKEKMEQKMLDRTNLELAKWSMIFVTLLSLIWFAGCTNNPADPQLSDKAAMLKLADGDEAINTFEANYDEGGALGLMQKVNTTIFPVKFGQRVHTVSRELIIDIPESISVEDTVEGQLIKIFEGNLVVAASYDPVTLRDTSKIDTVIVKPFTTTIIRNLKFVKIADDENPENNWRLIATSLPVGGVNGSTAVIDKMVITTGNDTLVIEDAGQFFLYKGDKKIMHHMRQWRAQLPQVKKGDSLSVMVEILTPYEGPEMVSLTYGADQKGLHRTKRLFELKSVQQEGNLYRKFYEKNWNTINQFIGHHHAIVNVIPKQVLFDDTAPVEVDTWGVPYFVKY